MTNIIVLDDERTFDTDSVTKYLRTATEGLAYFAELFTKNSTIPYGVVPDVIHELWLDHDLGEGGGEATTVVNFISALSRTNSRIYIQSIFVHSQNPVGAANLMASCQGLAPTVRRVPLPDLR
jgi:hypothetical protein